MKLVKKQAILDYFAEKVGYDYRPTYYMLEWNIKVYQQVWQVPGTPELDEAWETFSRNTPLIDWLCEDALSGLVGQPRQYDYFEFHSDKDLATANFVMWQVGRSGGHLVLEKFNGYRLVNKRLMEYIEDDPYEYLWVLYKFCKAIDEIVDNRHETLRQMFKEYRETWESEAK